MCSKVDDMFRRLCDALNRRASTTIPPSSSSPTTATTPATTASPRRSQNAFEDCLVRVPLLVKPPKGFGVDPGVTDSMAELVDFYATAMEFAGVAPRRIRTSAGA